MIYYCTQQDYTFYVTNIAVIYENEWSILKSTNTVQVVKMMRGPAGKHKHRIIIFLNTASQDLTSIIIEQGENFFSWYNSTYHEIEPHNFIFILLCVFIMWYHKDINIMNNQPSCTYREDRRKIKTLDDFLFRSI